MTHTKDSHSIGRLLCRMLAFVLMLQMMITPALAVLPSKLSNTQVGQSSQGEGLLPEASGLTDPNSPVPTLEELTGPGNLSTELKTSPSLEEAVVVEIMNPRELQALAQRVNNGDTMAGQTVCLMADLNLEELGSPWIPIGCTVETPFSGIFLGQGYSISGLNTTTAEGLESTPGGLFGFLIGAEIRDVEMVGAQAPSSVSGLYFAQSNTLLSGNGHHNKTSSFTRFQPAVSFSLRQTAPARASAARSSMPEMGVTSSNDTYFRIVNAMMGNAANTSAPQLKEKYVLIDAGTSVNVNGTSYNGVEQLMAISHVLSAATIKNNNWNAEGADANTTPHWDFHLYLTGIFDMSGVDWLPLNSEAGMVVNNNPSRGMRIIGVNCIIANLTSTRGGLVGRLMQGSEVKGITVYNPNIKKNNINVSSTQINLPGGTYNKWGPGGSQSNPTKGYLPYECHQSYNSTLNIGPSYEIKTGTNSIREAFSYNGSVGAVVNQLYQSSISDCAVIGGTVIGPQPGGVVGASTLSFDSNKSAIMNCVVKGTMIISTGEKVPTETSPASHASISGVDLDRTGGVGGIVNAMDTTSISRCSVVGATLIGHRIGGIAFSVNGASYSGDNVSAGAISQCAVLDVTVGLRNLPVNGGSAARNASQGCISGLYNLAYSAVSCTYNVVSSCQPDITTAGLFTSADTILNAALVTWDAKSQTRPNVGQGDTGHRSFTTVFTDYFTDISYDAMHLFSHDAAPNTTWKGFSTTLDTSTLTSIAEGDKNGKGLAQMHYDISNIVYDGTAAPRRKYSNLLAVVTTGTGINSKAIMDTMEYTTTQLTSSGFDKLNNVAWDTAAGYYPRLRTMAESDVKMSVSNAVNAAVADLASVPIRMTEEGANWHGTKGIILPDATAKGIPIVWSGSFTKLNNGATTVLDSTEAVNLLAIPSLVDEGVRQDIVNYYNTYNQGLEPLTLQNIDTILSKTAKMGILAKVMNGSNKKYIVIKEPVDDGTAYYNLQKETLYATGVTATITLADNKIPEYAKNYDPLKTAINTFKKTFGRIALVDSVLEENIPAAGPSRKMDGLFLASVNTVNTGLLNDRIYLEFDDEIFANQNARLVKLEYSTDDGKTWIQSGGIDASAAYKITTGQSITTDNDARDKPVVIEKNANGKWRIYFRFFIDLRGTQGYAAGTSGFNAVTGILPMAGALYRVTIPEGTVQENNNITTKVDDGRGILADYTVNSRINYSAEAILYFRTSDSSNAMINRVPGKSVVSRVPQGKYTDPAAAAQYETIKLNEFFTVDYSNLTYSVMSAALPSDIKVGGNISSGNVTILDYTQLKDLINAAKKDGSYTGNTTEISAFNPSQLNDYANDIAMGLRLTRDFSYYDGSSRATGMIARPWTDKNDVSLPLVFVTICDTKATAPTQDPWNVAAKPAIDSMVCPEPGKYRMYVFVMTGQWREGDGSDIRVTARGIDVYVESVRQWGSWLDLDGSYVGTGAAVVSPTGVSYRVAGATTLPQKFATPTVPAADPNAGLDPTQVRHMHVAYEENLTRWKNSLANSFKSAYKDANGASSTGKIVVDIVDSEEIRQRANGGNEYKALADYWAAQNQQWSTIDAAAWEEQQNAIWARLANGNYFKVYAQVCLAAVDGSRYIGTSTYDAPMLLEVYFDRLNMPAILRPDISVQAPVNGTTVEAKLRDLFIQGKEYDNIEYRVNDGSNKLVKDMMFENSGSYVVIGELKDLRSSACPQSDMKNPDKHAPIYTSTDSIKYVVNIYLPRNDDDLFWQKINYDIANTDTGNMVIREQNWRTDLGLETLETLQTHPYTAMRFIKDNLRWTVYGHQIGQYVTDHFADHARVTWSLGVENITVPEVLALVGSAKAHCVRFDQVGDNYFYMGFDMRVESDGKKSNQDWYLYAYDKEQNKLRYICDALVDKEGWAGTVLNKFYDTTYLFSTLPPTSSQVLLGWESDKSIGIHYNRNELVTKPPSEDPFNPAGQPEVEIIIPDIPNIPDTPENPAPEKDDQTFSNPASTIFGMMAQNPWIVIGLSAAAIIIAVAVLASRKHRGGIE